MPNPILTTSLSVGFDTLRSNPLRTILSTLGIVIGVAALVSVLSVGDGMERLARKQIGTTTDLQRISIAPRTVKIVDDTPIPVVNPVVLGLADAQSLRAALGDSADVNMLVSSAALVTTRADSTPHGTQVMGLIAPDPVMIPDSSILAGRAFSGAEGESGAPVAIISYRLASDYLGGRQARELIGDTLLFSGKPRAIIGVLRAVEGDRARRAIMPAGAAVPDDEHGVPRLDRSARLMATAKTVEGVATTRANIERWAAHQYGAAWKDRVSVVSDESRLAQIQRALLLFKLFMGALMSISLIVGGIGIMNVLLSSVIERTREIGIRKAAGAAQRQILWQFLAESVAITGVGSLIGLVLGVAAAFLVTAIMRRIAHAPVQAWLSASTIVVAIGASVVIGLTFGLYPAMRAARLSPIDAIRHE
ncbi:MAG TPA: ABC transporter permease [Gemmatimonadaceae bacterium]|jgi:putative ABC transport system permease protein